MAFDSLMPFYYSMTNSLELKIEVTEMLMDAEALGMFKLTICKRRNVLKTPQKTTEEAEFFLRSEKTFTVCSHVKKGGSRYVQRVHKKVETTCTLQ